MGRRTNARYFLVVVLAAGMLAACATRPPADDPEALAYYEEANDPLEPLNRATFGTNEVFYDGVLDPVATGYRAAPDPVNDAIRNFLRNLDSPLRFINNLLQGNFKQAGVTLARFVTNSTVGVGGLLDPAEDWGLHYRPEDFGQTLAVWGAEEDAYVVLPIFGPSSVRDVVGFIGDYFMDPVGWLLRGWDVGYLDTVRTGVTGLDTYSRRMDELNELEETSIDPYASVRSLQRQIRLNEIYNGNPPPEELPSDTPDDSGEFEDFPDFE